MGEKMTERGEWALAIAKEAGEFTLGYFDDPGLRVDRKKDGTPVTLADRGAEELLRRRIAERFPDDAILGEEMPDRAGSSGYKWILDPIDGTKSFIHGVPLYSTLVGIEKEGKPFAGVIAIPALGKGICAETGEGAYEWDKDGATRPARVSRTARLEDALFLTSEVKTFTETGRFELYRGMENRCRIARTWGDAYGYYMTATGRADLMIDPELSPWDAGPLSTILAEAGGVFADWSGRETIYGGDGLACNRLLFDRVVEMTKEYKK